MTISHEKMFAKMMLLTLRSSNLSAIVAGGAPRDWYMDKSAQDLDFYIECPTCIAFEETVNEAVKLVEDSFSVKLTPLFNVTNIVNVDRSDEELAPLFEMEDSEDPSKHYRVDYDHDSKVTASVEGEYNGIKFQLMFVRTDEEEKKSLEDFSDIVFNVFGLGLSKISFLIGEESKEMSGLFYVSQEFKRGFKDKVLEIFPECMTDKQKVVFIDRYLLKMVDRFPDYKVTYSENHKESNQQC